MICRLGSGHWLDLASVRLVMSLLRGCVLFADRVSPLVE